MFALPNGHGLGFSTVAYLLASISGVAVFAWLLAAFPGSTLGDARTGRLVALLFGSAVFYLLFRIREQRFGGKTLLVAVPLLLLSYFLTSRLAPGAEVMPVLVIVGLPVILGARFVAVYGTEACEHCNFQVSASTSRLLAADAASVWEAIGAREVPGFEMAHSMWNSDACEETLEVIEAGESFVATRTQGQITVKCEITLTSIDDSSTRVVCRQHAQLNLPDTRATERTLRRTRTTLDELTSHWFAGLQSDVSLSANGEPSDVEPTPTAVAAVEAPSEPA